MGIQCIRSQYTVYTPRARVPARDQFLAEQVSALLEFARSESAA
jgi:hypothetical protein